MYHMLDPNTVLRHRAAEIDRTLAARRQRTRIATGRGARRSATTRFLDQLRST